MIKRTKEHGRKDKIRLLLGLFTRMGDNGLDWLKCYKIQDHKIKSKTDTTQLSVNFVQIFKNSSEQH